MQWQVGMLGEVLGDRRFFCVWSFIDLYHRGPGYWFILLGLNVSR